MTISALSGSCGTSAACNCDHPARTT